MIPTLRLAAFYFAYLAALGAFSPYFPLWLHDRGLSAAAISGVMALWYGTRVVSPLLWGHLALHSPRPVRWLRIGALAALACFALFLLPLPLAGIVVAMAGFSFHYNALMPQFDAITLSHLHQRPQDYSRIRVWGSIGFLLSALLLGLLFERIGIGWLPAVMLPMLGALALCAFLNDYGPGLDAGDVARESLLASLRRPGVLAFIATAFLMQVAHGPYYVFFSLFLEQNGYRASALGGFWAIGVGAEILMFWFAAALLARWGGVRLIRLCLLVAVLRFAVTGLMPRSLPLLLLAQLSHAFTFGLFHSACMQRTARLFPGRLLGQGQGLLYGLGSGVGGVAGSLLAGWAWSAGGGAMAFGVAAAAAAAGALLAFLLMRPGDPGTRPAAPQALADEVP